MKRRLFLLLFFLSLFIFNRSWGDSNNNCSANWRELDWKLAPFIDLNARYFSFPFKIPKGQRIQFKVEGSFPYARYFSFHTYDQETENAISHLTDYAISPDSQSVNPFQIGVDRYSSNRKFSVWITPSQEASTTEQKLIIPFDDARDRSADIWVRVYASETKKIELPQIYAFDDSMNPIPCPKIVNKEWSIATTAGPYGLRIPSQEHQGRAPLPFKNGDVHFFRPSTDSLGANLDNLYLFSRLDGKALFRPLTIKGRRERRILKKNNAILNIGNITAFSFEVPSFPDTKSQLQYFSGEEDVRYWSICLSGPDTYTSACMMDSQVRTFEARDGKRYAIFVIGPNEPQLKLKVTKLGYNYLDHSEHRVPLIFYRQMLPRPDFDGRVDVVKPIPPSESQNHNVLWNFFAESYIGKYSPLGRQCWLESGFLQSFCGLKKNLR
ncbi:hypothetical protein EBQ74_06570 [bacterium]|nr:hypothetical protein [bacterium]